MLSQQKSVAIVLFALAIASLACGPPLTSTGGQPQPIEEVTLEPLEQATEEPAEPVVTAEPVDPANPVGGAGPAGDQPDLDALCPQPTAETKLHRNDANGFCFLYPAELTENPDWDIGFEGGVTVVSPPLDPNAIESLNSYVQVANTGPAGDLTTAQLYADTWAETYFPPEFLETFTRSEETIGGQPAVVLGNVPGRLAGRSAFVIANGYRYHLSIYPQPGEFENLDAAFGDIWGTIVGSLVFYAPSAPREAVRSADVCPAASDGFLLHVRESDGFCFLVPAAFEQDLTGGYNSSWFAAGAPFDTGTTMGEMRARVVFSWFGPAQDKTPMQLTEGFVAESGASRQELAVAGYPAVEFIDPRGPVPSRSLMLVVENNAYTLIATPYDSARWPDAAALLDQAWDSILTSLTFFDKLR